MDNYEVKLIPQEDLDSILPLLQLLNECTLPGDVKQRLEAMKQINYRCVGVYHEGKLGAISGIWILVKHYVGKHIEPDNVVVHPEYRGKKVGELLMEWIHTYAKQNECVASELNCYVANERGFKFWKRLGYEVLGYHMRKLI